MTTICVYIVLAIVSLWPLRVLLRYWRGEWRYKFGRKKWRHVKYPIDLFFRKTWRIDVNDEEEEDEDDFPSDTELGWRYCIGRHSREWKWSKEVWDERSDCAAAAMEAFHDWQLAESKKVAGMA